MHNQVRLLVEDLRTEQNSPSLHETLQLLVEIRNASDQILHEVVEQARCHPNQYSWNEIGAALGVGRTAAQKRFRAGLSGARKDELKEELYQAINFLKAELVRIHPLSVEDKRRAEFLRESIETLSSRYGLASHDQLEFDFRDSRPHS